MSDSCKKLSKINDVILHSELGSQAEIIRQAHSDEQVVSDRQCRDHRKLITVMPDYAPSGADQDIRSLTRRPDVTVTGRLREAHGRVERAQTQRGIVGGLQLAVIPEPYGLSMGGNHR